MEYSRSVGDIHETYIGTPEKIARLEMLMPKELKGGDIGEGSEMSDIDNDRIARVLVEGLKKASIVLGY